jgi:hypothetical protein
MAVLGFRSLVFVSCPWSVVSCAVADNLVFGSCYFVDRSILYLPKTIHETTRTNTNYLLASRTD